MNIGDIVVVVNSESIPKHYLGCYGVITNIYESKVVVQLKERVFGIGIMSHTAFPSDLKKIGETNY